MSLKKKLFTAFFIIILVPVVLTGMFLLGTFIFQSQAIYEKYGVDLRNLEPFDRTLIADILFSMVVILIITALVLSIWLYRAIQSPLTSLTNATENIRDGNLDFELKPEGDVEEIRSLFESFEEMRVRLKAANEEKIVFDEQNRELISNISHDLRTPITAVKGYCEGLIDGVADTPEKQERYVRTIYNKTIEMDRLINELSFYSKITTNRIPYAFSEVNVKAFFNDAADELGMSLGAEGVEFTYKNTVPADVAVIADVEQITRVLHNIISNAEKYTDKPEKRIDLDVSLHGDEVVAAVSDNGKGIAVKDLPNIFDRFYRTDSSRNSRQGGSGIGLSIVKKIVEDHGGRVWAKSTEGEGTTMYFALRRYEEKRGEENEASEKQDKKR